ncbi:unnamed protein product [Ceratitis capitata]|uniref:(Mediterranean fruit fly) hypothetical protein n=1 Tax=Ceratitis capitata TaxID=7213 RepID=A0A811UP35_CERCA|nr:unnamed protein product [Ceratitis capitata]
MANVQAVDVMQEKLGDGAEEETTLAIVDLQTLMLSLKFYIRLFLIEMRLRAGGNLEAQHTSIPRPGYQHSCLKTRHEKQRNDRGHHGV